MAKAKSDFVVFPVTVLVDTAEQLPYCFRALLHDDGSPGHGLSCPHCGREVLAPLVADDLGAYTFMGLRADAAQDHLPLVIKVRYTSLTWGDYSLEGYEDRVAVERKSKADLFGTLGHGRQRFERELAALAGYDFAAVVMECTWPEIFLAPPEHSRMDPKAVARSILAWQQRYPTIHWLPAGPRELAEKLTFRVLERYHRDQERARVNLEGITD